MQLPGKIVYETSCNRTTAVHFKDSHRIPRSAIKDRKLATFLYAQYVLQKVLAEKNAVPEPFDGPHIQQQTFFLMTLRDYFQSSFWDAVKQNEFPPATVLWEIRSSLGKRFTDRLASFILRELADTPQETFDPDMNVSFVKSLKVADNTIEAQQQTWAKIQYIIDHYLFSSE